MPDTVKLTIDGREAEVPAGTTVLEAAASLDIAIPTLCHLAGAKPLNSCFVCVVEIEGAPSMKPACSTPVAEGMVVRSNADVVRDARRTALELLLSEHTGDCEGPCTLACPADLDIPTMVDRLLENDPAGAIAVARETIPLNAVLGRICPRFCERACRRGQIDEAVAIADLQKHVGDLAITETPEPAPDTGKRVAVVGAGPAGLTAGWYLRLAGHACTLLDASDVPGGRLRELPATQLPPATLDAEIDVIRRLGAEFRQNTRLGADLSLDDLRRDFDAVLIATGAPVTVEGVAPTINAGRAADLALAGQFGLDVAKRGIAADARTTRTNLDGVFAAGECVAGPNAAVRAVKSGRLAAVAVDQFLAGVDVTGEARFVNVRMGKLTDDELAVFARDADDATRVAMPSAEREVTAEQALAEARRCVRCACAAKRDCRLRDAATEYGASATRFRGGPHRPFARDASHPDVVYESGKCLLCGLCIRAAREAHETLGLAFHARGFATTVAVPFEQQLVEGLAVAAEVCVSACPTGALAWKRGHEPPVNEG